MKTLGCRRSGIAGVERWLVNLGATSGQFSGITTSATLIVASKLSLFLIPLVGSSFVLDVVEELV